MRTLNLAGDIMVGGDFSRSASDLIPRSVPADALERLATGISIANLEAGFSNRGPGTENKILVYALEAAAGVLTHLRLDAVNIANNHIFDYGIEAVEDTTAILRSLGIGWFGAGRTLAEAASPWVAETGAGIVAAIGFSWTDEWVQPAPAATDDSPGVNPIEPAHIARTIDRVLDEYSPDTLVVSLHWGEGMSRYPRPDALRLVRGIIDRGAHVVMGHHPHCLQPYETYGGGVVFHSLGNLIASPYTKHGTILTYDEGPTRIRTLRERLTTIATVEHGDDGVTVRHIPLVQDREEPVLRHPGPDEALTIDRVFVRNASRLGRLYRPRYWFLRRSDEIVSKLEEVREFGWGSFSWRTPFRALRRLITGRNMH